jgi:hypothetical protein
MTRLPSVFPALGVLLVAAGVTAGAAVLPARSPSLRSVRQALPVSLTTPSLVCPGPETLLVPDGGQPADPGAPVLIRALLAVPSEAASAQLKLLGEALPSGPGTALPEGTVTARDLQLDAGSGATSIGTLAGTRLGPAELRTTSDPGSITDPKQAPMLAGVQSTLARTGNLRGLTATACTAPQPDSWLVGGATGDGERLRLLLANPGAAPAVADLDVYGPDGKVSAPSGDGVLVAPGAEVPIFIDALAPGLDAVAVHVTTRSGRVRATLHDSLLRGLTPSGADDVPVGTAPAKRQVIPGVSLINAYTKTAGDPNAAGSTSLRVAVPGSEEAVVRIRLLDSTGPVELPRTAVVSVPAGGVVDVPVSGLPSGTYTAVVDADVPIVAAARVGRPGSVGAVKAAEFGWAGSVAPLTGAGYAALPPGTRSTLSLGAIKDAGRLVVTEVRSDGTFGPPIDVSVPARGSATVQIADPAVAIRIDQLGGGPVAASIVSTATDPRGQLISVLPVAPASASVPPEAAVLDSRLGLR